MFLKFFFTLLLSLPLLLLATPAVAESQVTGTNLSELGGILNRIITFLFGLIGGITIIIIVVGGIRYILAGGDPKATMAAKQTITFALIGLIVVLLSVVIISIVGDTLGAKDLQIIRIGIN